MLCVNCSCELGKPEKRRREEENGTTATTNDRLSHLPEPILYHILSFLDTKSAVRTSKLSRSWSRVWKHVPVLDLYGNAFKYACRFETFVGRVLSLRYPLKLHKVVYVSTAGPSNENHKKRLVKVIHYAFSHDVQQLVVDTARMYYVDDIERMYRFSKLFYSYPSYNLFVMSGRNFSSLNLKTLELSWIALDDGFLRCSGLPMLTTLKITSCLLVLDRHQKEGIVDLFSNFPCLANLAVSNCFLSDRKTVGRMRISVLKVSFVLILFFHHNSANTQQSGPQLLSLELDKTEQFQIEIFAPKLDFFSVCQDVNNAQGFIELSLPTLDRADIALTQKQTIHLNKKAPYEHHYLKSLFPGLHNAKSLKLDSSIVQFLKKDLYPQLAPSMGFETVFAPLNDGHFINPIFQPQGYTILMPCTSTVQESYLDQEPSPFTRLETLIVSSYGLPFVESLFHDLYSGKPSKMGRYTVKALPLENGWEFVDPRANYLSMYHQHQGGQQELGCMSIGWGISKYEFYRWEKVIDYFFKESSCEEPIVMLDFAGSNYVRKLL